MGKKVEGGLDDIIFNNDDIMEAIDEIYRLRLLLARMAIQPCF